MSKNNLWLINSAYQTKNNVFESQHIVYKQLKIQVLTFHLNKAEIILKSLTVNEQITGPKQTAHKSEMGLLVWMIMHSKAN